jgi:hypothetical protein
MCKSFILNTLCAISGSRIAFPRAGGDDYCDGYRAALVRAKQLIEREISHIVRSKNPCIRNLSTTKSKTVMTADEKLDKIIAILERMEARQIGLKEGVEEIQTHEPPVQGSFATVNTGQQAAPKPVS